MKITTKRWIAEAVAHSMHSYVTENKECCKSETVINDKAELKSLVSDIDRYCSEMIHHYPEIEDVNELFEEISKVTTQLEENLGEVVVVESK